MFPLASVSRPALGPTQPPVQWVPGVQPRRQLWTSYSPPWELEISQEHIHCTGNWQTLTRICIKLTLNLMRYVNLQNGKLRNVGLRIAYKLRRRLQYLSFDLCELRQGTIYFCVGGMPGACLADHVAVTGIPHLVARHGIPNKSHAKTHVVFFVTRTLLFSDLNQNWNVSTHFSRTPQCKISWKSVQRLSSCYTRTGGHG
jgi:hypothetical protein